MEVSRASTALAATIVLAGAVYALARRRRKMKQHFAPMATQLDAQTQANLTRHRWLQLRHGIVHDAVAPEKLAAAFDGIRAAFRPQQVDYSNTAYGKDHWNLSCFMQYTNGVATKKVDLAAGAPMRKVCEPILQDCDRVFLEWYDKLHPRPRDATRTLGRMQSFVTRYRPMPEESHLPRHIDGANVDGSLVLGLPTYSEFGTSGGLTVWDGENDAEVFRYPVAAGDACLLDSRVWHQSNPITHGERWVIVIFYTVQTDRPGKANAEPRQAVVRGLLAKRIKDAARRKEVAATAAKAEAAKKPTAWHED